jgi:hypothetical protein
MYISYRDVGLYRPERGADHKRLITCVELKFVEFYFRSLYSFKPLLLGTAEFCSWLRTKAAFTFEQVAMSGGTDSAYWRVQIMKLLTIFSVPVWTRDRIPPPWPCESRGDEKGSLKSESVKYGRESQGTRTQERLNWQGPAAYTKDRPVLLSERAPQTNKPANVRQ